MSKEFKIVFLPGDGIGVEVCHWAQKLVSRVSETLKVPMVQTVIPCGGQYYLKDGSRDWPEGSEKLCKEADAILLGAVGWPDPSGRGPVTMKNGKMAGFSAVIGNRVGLDLYANVRPVKLLPGVRHRISGKAATVWEPKNVDMVFVRENTEGLYAGMGGVLMSEGKASVATDTRVITRKASEKVIRRAFQICKDRDRGAPGDGKKRVTCIVKNNVLDGCRLFVDVFREVGKEYPDIDQELSIIDAFTQFLITQPEHYDVCVTTNMFGDIVTDLASVLQGGMGMAVGCNLGDKHAMFEPIHGSAPPLAGKDSANPLATLLAVAEMFSWLGTENNNSSLREAGAVIEKVIAAQIESGSPLTEDIVGKENAKSLSAVATAVMDGVVAPLNLIASK